MMYAVISLGLSVDTSAPDASSLYPDTMAVMFSGVSAETSVPVVASAYAFT